MISVNDFVYGLVREKEKAKLIGDLLVKLGRVVCHDTNSNRFEFEVDGRGPDREIKVFFSCKLGPIKTRK
jgi:hypothetical protein